MQPQQPRPPEAAPQPQSADALVASIRALVGSLPGATGIGAAAVFTNPADVAKTRLAMTHELQPPSAKRPSVLKTLQNIWRYEGMAGLLLF